MKKNIILLYCTLLLGVFTSCYSLRLKPSVLANKTFEIEDTMRRAESIKFINDSTCVYVQEFHCNINEIYRKVSINCSYRLLKNYIILEKATDLPDYLESVSCFKLPESEIEKCDFINVDTLEDPFIYDLRCGWNKADAYGYINNINNDTLYFHKGIIFYGKSVRCFGRNGVHTGTVLYEKNINKRLNNKQTSKIFYRSRKVPFNR